MRPGTARRQGHPDDFTRPLDEIESIERFRDDLVARALAEAQPSEST